MDIRQLQYFVEVARQKNFTKASQTLLVSQPSISKMIKTLEDQLGVQLLDRSEREVELTDAGALVYEQAVRIIQSMDDLSDSVNELVHVKRGKVKMGLLPTVGALLFPKIMANFKKEFPRIDIQLAEYSAKHVEANVAKGEIDFGVTVLPVDTEIFETVFLHAEELVLIVDRKHRLAGRESIELIECQEESFILFSEEFALHDVAMQACRQAGFEPKAAYMSTMWDLVCEMVATEFGVSLVPKSMAAKLNNKRVHAIPIAKPHIAWEWALIYRKDRYQSYAARAFISYVQQHTPFVVPK
ncbi:LysR family transcriptional regulator [Paenibacillus sp. N1-5-1-14]|uniref:LysR family transcriptional regulator n=1 Tax=Paenibacillus radicibacter TaxID=2972488 RepID=UPI0021598FF2|nr:LysR family transcriptional regulator [Paenibacillus radicibacter]MCR8644878.1 LysR family transcriptional regulator [Paenibacillus radicibacter]